MNQIEFTDYASFREYSADSGKNNAARALYRQVLELNGLQRNTLIIDDDGVIIGRDNRQQVMLNGKMYAVTVGDNKECRQFDVEDYHGILHIDPRDGSIWISHKSDLKINTKSPNLIRSKTKTPACNAKMNNPSIVGGLKIWR